MNSIVALPIVSAMPIAMPEISERRTDWAKPERELAQIVRQVSELDREIALRSRAFKRWEARNPWPVEPSYDSCAAQKADFSRQKEAERVHVVRYQNALIQCGRGRLQKRSLDLVERYRETCAGIARLPASTLDEIQQKARLARRLESQGGAIHVAVLHDLHKLSA